jgi:hypothetical protein
MYNKTMGGNMIELGTEKDIYVKINSCLKQLKTENNKYKKIALYNYLANLYMALSSIKGRKMYPSKRKVFSNLENYRKFNKWTDILIDRFNNNFIFYKSFHQIYIEEILANTEDLFLEKIDGQDYSKEDPYFTEADFKLIFHDFCKSLGLEKYYNEIINNKKIYFMLKDNKPNSYAGITLHNPLNGESDILIDRFDYDVGSLFILAHELGHYYDLREFNNNDNIKAYLDYEYLSLYQEVISKIFERLILSYLIKNNIKREVAEDKLIDMEIINRDSLYDTYIVTLLEDKYIEKDKYQLLSNKALYNMVKDKFEETDDLIKAFNSKNLNLSSDILYAYGDIISMFLKEIVNSEGLNSPSMKKFMNTRYQEFDTDYIESENFKPEKYKELYEKEIQLIKKG